jgi:hypothetical protein
LVEARCLCRQRQMPFRSGNGSPHLQKQKNQWKSTFTLTDLRLPLYTCSPLSIYCKHLSDSQIRIRYADVKLGIGFELPLWSLKRKKKAIPGGASTLRLRELRSAARAGALRHGFGILVSTADCTRGCCPAGLSLLDSCRPAASLNEMPMGARISCERSVTVLM